MAQGDCPEQSRRSATAEPPRVGVRAACAWLLCMQKQEWTENPLYRSQLQRNVATRRFGLCLWLQAQGTVHALLQLWAGWLGDALPGCKAWHKQGDDAGAWHILLFSAVLLRLHDFFKGAVELGLFLSIHPFQPPPWGSQLGALPHPCPASDSDDTSCCQRPGSNRSSATPSCSRESA